MMCNDKMTSKHICKLTVIVCMQREIISLFTNNSILAIATRHSLEVVAYLVPL